MHEYDPPMRFRLRTLLIVVALGPPLLAGAWWSAEATIAGWRKPPANPASVVDYEAGFQMGGCKFTW